MKRFTVTAEVTVVVELETVYQPEGMSTPLDAFEADEDQVNRAVVAEIEKRATLLGVRGERGGGGSIEVLADTLVIDAIHEED